MKQLEYIKKLLGNASVQWELLGNVTNYEQSSKYTVKSKEYKDEYDTPVLTAGKTFLLGYTNETDKIYKASINPVIIFDDFTTATKWVDFDFKVKSSAIKMITSADESVVLLKYIYYWLNTLPNEVIDTDHKRQWISNFTIKDIPIVPMNVQKEIVRILDSFTELQKELQKQLEKELQLQQKQYEYYRKALYVF